MDFSIAQDLWRRQPERSGGPSDDELLREVVRRDRALRRRALRRDIIELGTALSLAGGFGWKTATAAAAWPWLVATLVVLAVAGVFVRERVRRSPTAGEAASVRAGLQNALDEVDHQIRLLTSVVWWYLVPLGLVLILTLLGSALDARARMAPDAWAAERVTIGLAFSCALIVVAGLYWLLWRMNVRTVRVMLRPEKEQIELALERLTQQ